MDDECVEELGRPISSLKVSELRDELAKRALIKTGKKNELVDRLRQAISKQSTSSQQSTTDLPADLTVQSDSGNRAESAIDYSTPQILPSDMASSQQQVSMPAADAVEFPATNESSDQQDELLLQQEEQRQREEDLIKAEILRKEQTEREELRMLQEQEEIKMQQEQEKQKQEIEEQNKLDELKRQQSEQEEKRQQSELEARQREIELQKEQERKLSQEVESDQKSHDAEANLDDLNKEALLGDPNDVIETSQETRPLEEIDQVTQSEPKSESSVPITFTLKRGNRDGSLSNKAEKRRKWSGKASESGQASDSQVVQGGISSQKLKELIDLKQLESIESPVKDVSSQSAETISKKKDEVKKSQSTDNQLKKVTESSQSTKSVDVKEKPSNDTKLESKQEENPTINHEPSQNEVTEPTNWLMIQNLMRPYTVTQLKEELTKFGPIIDDKFWTDKVKSKCCVLYETIEAAQQTKESMQGQHWPLSNPKSLVVSFITEEDYKAHIAADIKPIKVATKSDDTGKKAVNGSAEKANKQTNNRLVDRLETADIGGSSIQQRLGEKLGGDAVDGKPNRIDLVDLQPKELDDFFRRTKTKPQLFWLPLNEEQAEARKADREERDKRAKESSHNANSASRRSPIPPPARRRSPNPARRSPQRHRSPVTRSPMRRRSPVRRRTPPPPSRRSPARRRPPPSPRDSPPPRRRSPIREHSPLLRRRASPKDSPPPMRRRTPQRDSPPFRRRTPVRDSPPPIRRRSPSPLLRRRTPPRDSPPIRRRSPHQGRSPVMYRRSPEIMLRRSPGPVRRMSPGRRSPGTIRRSPGLMRRSPGLMRRSPGPLRRSPGPVRRSPGPIRRSPGPMRRSPGPTRRMLPGLVRRPRGARDYD